MMLKKVYMLALSICISLVSLAQVSIERSVIGPLGILSSSEKIQISATVGEVVVSTFETEKSILTQGFQQAENEDLVSSYRSESILSGLSVFPNPASDILSVKISSIDSDDLIFSIHDIFGRVLTSQPRIKVLSGIEETINLEVNTLATGTYYLRILNSKGQLAGSVPFLVN